MKHEVILRDTVGDECVITKVCHADVHLPDNDSLCDWIDIIIGSVAVHICLEKDRVLVEGRRAVLSHLNNGDWNVGADFDGDPLWQHDITDDANREMEQE